MIDYRGFGRSSGWPTEGGLYRDAEAAYYYLLQREYSASHIVLHGESLGTAVAVDLAARHAAAGLILEAPFTSAHQLAASVRWTPAHLELRFARKIRTIHTPLFIIHGDRDELIPQQMGTALFAAAAEPKLFWSVPGAGLNDILETAGPDYVTRLRNYYAGLSQRTPAILPD